MEVKEWKGDIVFMHTVIPGSADRSYGIHVAQIAGLPKSVTERAYAVLEHIQKRTHDKKKGLNIDDLPLFDIANENDPEEPTSKAEQILGDTNPDTLSPRDALDLIYKLKGLV